MRVARILIAILLLTGSVFAQDSTQISYSEIQDTMVKQRFIDRYENVFMTKVPTRHMFKVGISQYNGGETRPLFQEKPFYDLALQIGYEFKFLPAFSIALSGHIPNYGTSSTIKRSWSNTLLDGQLRWYFDMKRRIRNGKSANNFSGNYIALNYYRFGTINQDPQTKFDTKIGLRFGIQRRFFNSGYLDFSMGLHQENPWFHYGLLYNWTFSTQTSLGFAFGDWKKAKDIPICDVFLCEQNIEKQWKVRLPELSFGYYLNRIRAGVAYEQRFKQSPLTFNFQIDAAISKGYNYFTYNELYPSSKINTSFRSLMALSREAFITFSIQPRYYYLQKQQQRRGKSSNGMSSLYAGLNLENNFYLGKHGYFTGIPTERPARFNQNTLHIGPMLGFQQRVFKNGYIDLNTSYNYKREFYSSENSFGFRGNLSVGLAF
jgi:hypothetical protein